MAINHQYWASKKCPFGMYPKGHFAKAIIQLLLISLSYVACQRHSRGEALRNS